MRVQTNSGMKGGGIKKWLLMERCDFCGINSLQLPPSRMWMLFFISGGGLMWCFVSVGAFFPPDERRDWAARLEKRFSRYASLSSSENQPQHFFSFFLRQHLATMRKSAPLGFPSCEASFSVHVSSPRLPAEENAAFSCLKWKEVSRGVTKYTGDCFWLLRSRYEELLTAARPSPPPSVWCLSLAAIFPSS